MDHRKRNGDYKRNIDPSSKVIRRLRFDNSDDEEVEASTQQEKDCCTKMEGMKLERADETVQHDKDNEKSETVTKEPEKK